jgi:hypothetical protein
MTTYFNQRVTCAACQQPCDQTVLGSTNAFGSCDLDLRPPEMKRSTMGAWVQSCPHCGYCWPELEQAWPGAAKAVAEQTYQAQLHAPDTPTLVNRFLCTALLQEHAGQPDRAGWYALYAAWVCDDLDKIDAARACRKKAYEHFLAARAGKQSFAQDPLTEDVLVIDVLRRMGYFDEAANHCAMAMEKQPSGVLLQVIDFQRRLLAKQDARCYTVEEATKETQ